ncbi:MAG: hypothetical protein LBC65_06005 [Oscillospiraceae bacterium]|jgi:hypothetical protein|nr:hypothetical protein [Oscillospiraceae bacterium]
MFGTYERFNLVRGSFGRHASNTYIFEDYYKHGLLRLGNNFTGDSLNNTDFAFDIKLTVNGAPVKYSYFADEGSLVFSSHGARAEIALTSRNHFRIRGENCGVRLELRSASRFAGGNSARALRGVFAKPDGSGTEAEFGRFGKLFFKAISGNYVVNAQFDRNSNCYAYMTIDFVPDASTGEFDAAIHDYQDKLWPFGEYEEFDELVEDNREDYSAFSKIYRAPAAGYEEMTKYAIWTVWSHRTKAIGSFKQPHILFQNSWSCAAAPWQQSYNAMAMLGDPSEAWRQICLMFLYQDERTGRVPNMVTYSSPPMAGMQPAFQGFALDYLFRKLGDEFITPEEAARMYPKMAAWINYWITYRNAGRGDDVTVVLSPHESGWDDSSQYKDGFPAEDPNTMTFLILLMEAVAKLAAKIGKDEESQEWISRSRRLCKTLISEYWNGEKFVTKVKGKNVNDAQSLANFQPIILGKRLPQEIIDKIAATMTTDGEWLTEIGLATENVNSSLATYGISFICGRVVGPLNMIIAVGLQAAGKQKEAELVARRFCDQVKREGIILGYAPYNYYKRDGSKADQQIPPQPADGWPWSSWSANCFLTMVTGVIGQG